MPDLMSSKPFSVRPLCILLRYLHKRPVPILPGLHTCEAWRLISTLLGPGISPHTIPIIHILYPPFQVCCYCLTSILREQPEAVRSSYWARHWACAVDVMELLSTEAALLMSGGGDQGGISSEEAEQIFGSAEGQLVQLINEQYRPGGQYNHG